MTRDIQVNEDTYQRLQDLVTPLFTMDDVIRRLLDNFDNTETEYISPPEETYTSEEHTTARGTKSELYRRAILESLYEMGGSGQVDATLRSVEEKLRPHLSVWDYEREKPDSTGEIRWRHAAHTARNGMAHKYGLLKNNSPRGVWELTPEGIAQAKSMTG